MKFLIFTGPFVCSVFIGTLFLNSGAAFASGRSESISSITNRVRNLQVDPRTQYISENLPHYSSAESSIPIYTNKDLALSDRGVGALVGLAVGDAVGVALEFDHRPSHVSHVVTDMVGNPYLFGGVRVGEWTDDTSMALALGESLINHGQFVSYDVLYKWHQWMELGYVNPRNYREDRTEKYLPAFDIGSTTRAALKRFGKHWQDYQSEQAYPGRDVCNSRGPCYSANGTIMRLAPIPLFYHGYAYDQDAKALLDHAEKQSLLTHGNIASADAARVMAYMITLAMAGASKEDVLSAKGFDLTSFDPENSDSVRIKALFKPNARWRTKTRSQLVKPPGDTTGGSAEFGLECALWSISKTKNFRDAVLLSINLGADADTVGAIVGQIAGALYGMKGIPTEWTNKIVASGEIQALAIQLMAAGKNYHLRTAGGSSSSSSQAYRPASVFPHFSIE